MCSEPFLISICDDDEIMRDALEALLQSLGHVTAAFASAEAFLRSGLLSNTACLISDMQMPGMSGAQLLQCLRVQGRHPPVIFVTADCSAGLRPTLIAAGAAEVLPKPFDKDDFIACLQRALVVRKSG